MFTAGSKRRARASASSRTARGARSVRGSILPPRVLEAAGAARGPVYGPMSGRRALRGRPRTRPHPSSRLVDELASTLVRERVECVVGDAEEGYNPSHDICRLVVNAAVRLVNRTTGRARQLRLHAGRPARPLSRGAARRLDPARPRRRGLRAQALGGAQLPGAARRGGGRAQRRRERGVARAPGPRTPDRLGVRDAARTTSASSGCAPSRPDATGRPYRRSAPSTKGTAKGRCGRALPARAALPRTRPAAGRGAGRARREEQLMEGLKVLIANATLASLTGTETYVRDLALGLLRQGAHPHRLRPGAGRAGQTVARRDGAGR